MALAIGNTKKCSSCKEVKPLTAFFKNKVTADGLQNACNKCKAIIHKNWKYSLKSRHYDNLVKIQNGLCAVCGKKPIDGLLIDHNHNTGNLRSLLCRKCNTILGMANDSIEILENAVNYLKQWTEE